MSPTQKAAGMGWAVWPGNHSIVTDLIGAEIADWNDTARYEQARALDRPDRIDAAKHN